MKKTLFILSLLTLSACTSPAARIQPQIEEFKSRYPKQIALVRTRAHNLKYAWSGDPKSPPLVFIHGSPGSWEGWAEFLLHADLRKRFQVIAVDRLGYGGSDPGISQGSLANQANAIITILQANQSGKPAILVGHSYGGAVAAALAIEYPDQISAVVFVASSVDPELERTKWFQYPATWWPIRQLIPEMLRVCNEEILALKGELQALRPHWNKIRARVATIQGEADDLVPAQNQDFITANISPKQLVYRERIATMNHFVPWEHPGLILAAIALLTEN